MGGIHVIIDTGKLTETVWEFQACLEEAGSCMEEIEGEVCSLEDVWAGKAREVFCVRIRKDLAYLDEYLKEMRKFAACLEFAGKEYDRTGQEMEVYMGRW